MVQLFEYTGTDGPFQVYGVVDKSLYKCFSMEQWVVTDVFLLNYNNVPVADGIRKSSGPYESIDTKFDAWFLCHF